MFDISFTCMYLDMDIPMFASLLLNMFNIHCNEVCLKSSVDENKMLICNLALVRR